MSAQLHVEFSPQRLNVDMGGTQRVEQPFSYEQLTDKPAINGVELIGDKTSAQFGIDQTYTYEQTVAAAEWTTQHNLGKYPSVAIVDSAGTECVGDVQYIDEDTIICRFGGAFSGKAYLN